jgi:hypothetical protein
VTLLKGQTTVTVHVRLPGGATRTLELPRPLSMAQIRQFKPEIVAEVDRLLEHHRDQQIADISLSVSTRRSGLRSTPTAK